MPPRTRSTRSAATAAQTTLQGLKVSKAKTAPKQLLENVTNKKSDDVEECTKVKPTLEVVIEKVAKTETTTATKTRGKTAATKTTKSTRATRRTKVAVQIEEEAKKEDPKEEESAEQTDKKGEDGTEEPKPVAQEPVLEVAPEAESTPVTESEEKPAEEAPVAPAEPVAAPATPAKTPSRRTRKAPAKTPSKTPSKTPAKTPRTSRKRKARSPSPLPVPSPIVNIPALLSTLDPKNSDDDLDILPTFTPEATASATPPPTKRTRLDTYLPSASTTPAPPTHSLDTLPEVLRVYPPVFAALHTAHTLHTSLLPSGVHPPLSSLMPTLQRLIPHTHITLSLLRTLLSLTPRYKLIDMGPPRGLCIRALSPLPGPESLKSEFLAHLHTLGPAPVLKEAGVQPHKTLSTIAHVMGKKTRDIREFLAKPAAAEGERAVKKTGSTAERSSGLLERIRAKEEALRKNAKTEEEMLREAARGRVAEVKGILKGLRTRERGGSVGLHKAVEVVRESVRLPVDKGVAEWAVRLCAEEEGWVKVVKWGEVEGVVFKTEAAAKNRFI